MGQRVRTGAFATKPLVALLLAALLGAGGYFLFAHRAAPVADGEPTNTASFACDAGKRIGAQFYDDSSASANTPGQPPTPTGHVVLTLSDGRTRTLPHVIAADGARYESPDGAFEFWTKGNGAFVVERNQQTYRGCIVVAPARGDLTQVYVSGAEGFSIRYPAGYKVDAQYRYEALGPGKVIGGVSFTIPPRLAAGTNLAADTYLSVEEIPASASCDARMFLDAGSGGKMSSTQTIHGTTYSVAVSTGAGAGNRYEETVYARPFTNPCIAVRYFIHDNVIENYPPGTVRAFDERALLAAFDAIRDTLRIQQ
jgi:membrane-bound inhibitor of C-type lysozyme